jgi:methyltransferase (TIGR00027 family)
MPAETFSLTTLALSAWWTAAARTRESGRADRLFDDPWAAVLVGTPSAHDYERVSGGDPIDDLHAVSTRFFDEFLFQATHERHIRQVVLLACGLDARAYRLDWPANTRLIELDQSHVIAYKNCILSLNNARPACDRQAVGVNLNEPWLDQIVNAGLCPSEPSAWLVEQSLYFFDQPAVRSLLETITRLSAPGSCLGFDVVNSAMLTSTATRRWNERMAAAGAPWLFTPDEPETLLADFGWSVSVVEPGAGAADFGRYPYVITPRSEASAPRLFLVTATRG